MEEYLDVINENDEVIGKATKEECHKKKLLHRGSCVLIFNKKGELLIQKRSRLNINWKGYWAASAGGHVYVGETYEDAAKRELEEELDIVTDNLEFLFKIIDESCPSIDAVFKCIHDGPFKLNEEVEILEFIELNNLKEEILKNKRPFAKPFVERFNKYLEEFGHEEL